MNTAKILKKKKKKNPNKQNLAAYDKDYTPWPSEIYSWNAQVQYMKTDQCNRPHQQTMEGKKTCDHLN